MFIYTNNKFEYIGPYGLDDLFNHIVKPTPNFNLISFIEKE
ncbi:hypothetical protein [Tenacibaculum sp. nBUS_03]